jgi:predicted nucleotidyltransferase
MNEIQILDAGYAPLFNAIVAWAGEQDAIRALLISGSVAKGSADAYSDLDFVVVTHKSAIEGLMEDVHRIIDDVEPVIIENRLPPGRASVLSVVTDGWHRIDLAFGDPDSGILQQALIPVFDPDTLFDGVPDANVLAPVDADQVVALSKEFLRVLGLSAVVHGRKDAHTAHDGSNLLRNMLIELFLMEPPRRTRSSAKKTLPLLTLEQQEVLKSLPPLADNLEMLVVFDSALAEVFLLRARRLIESIGGVWPVATEQATREYLKGMALD